MNQEPLPAQGPVDVNVRPDVPSAYRTFEDMCWAVPGARMDDLEYRMRYAAQDAVFTMSERLTIASFLSAYREIVRLPQKERNERIKEIRQGPNASLSCAEPLYGEASARSES